MIAFFKGVHVIPIAQPYIHLTSQNFLRPCEIAGGCDLHIVLFAVHDRHVQSKGAGDLDIIRSRAVKGAMCCQNSLKMKALRCLRPKKAFAVLRTCHNAVGAAPQGVGDSKGRGRALGCFQSRQHP